MSEVKLFQGDCLTIMQDLIDDDVKVDLVLTDPPYGTTACKWDSIIPFDEMWSCIKIVVRNENTPIIFFATQPFSSYLVSENLKGFKHEWIWQKERGVGFQVAKYRPMQEHEHILVFTCNGKKVNYYPIKEKRDNPVTYNSAGTSSDVSPLANITKTKYIYTDKYPTSIKKFRRESKRLHPTQKPVKLLEYLIKTYTKENDTVLDFTMGSGSTGVACLETNRNFIGIELEPKYYEIAEQRIKEAKAQRRLI